MALMRVSFEVLDGLLERLTERIWEKQISVDTYVAEFDLVLEFAGWTEEQFIEEIDKRWTANRKASQVFLC